MIVLAILTTAGLGIRRFMTRNRTDRILVRVQSEQDPC
jgi:hypothetical protein